MKGEYSRAPTSKRLTSGAPLFRYVLGARTQERPLNRRLQMRMNPLDWGRHRSDERSCFTGNSRKYELAWIAQECENLDGGESLCESPNPQVIGRTYCQSWPFLRLVGPLSPFSTFERERWQRLDFHAAIKLLFFIIQPTTELS